MIPPITVRRTIATSCNGISSSSYNPQVVVNEHGIISKYNTATPETWERSDLPYVLLTVTCTSLDDPTRSFELRRKVGMTAATHKRLTEKTKVQLHDKAERDIVTRLFDFQLEPWIIKDVVRDFLDGKAPDPNQYPWQGKELSIKDGWTSNRDGEVCNGPSRGNWTLKCDYRPCQEIELEDGR